MQEKEYEIKSLQIEYQSKPLGLDIEYPRFSWNIECKMRSSRQSAFRICVGTSVGDSDMWDSGKVVTEESNEIVYNGKKLAACTKYCVKVSVWDKEDKHDSTETFFETGMMDSSMTAWEDAQWIGAPHFTVDAQNRGIFAIESNLCIRDGSKRAGIVFGANDKRLMTESMNEMLIAGENYIRYELDVENIPAVLNIYRVGYASMDNMEIPLAAIPVVNYKGEEKTPVITQENRYKPHCLKIEVTGNCAYAYVDGILVDADEKNWFNGEKMTIPRQINHRDVNDTITYPRLNEIGFYAGPEDEVVFENITVKNLRTPNAIFIKETPKGNLLGKENIFQQYINKGTLSTEDNFFLLKGGITGIQITADPSNTSIPMLRRNFMVKAENKVKSARLYATARGIYDCQVNGHPISDQWFAPGASQFDKHLMYQTYDVTGLLKDGENGIGFTLAPGWWCDGQTFALRNYNYFGDKESLLAKLVVTYEDGTRERYITNTEEWEYCGDGPYTYASFFHGEHYDARKAEIFEDYSKPDYDCRNWEKPVIITPVLIESFSTMPPGFGRVWPAVNIQEPEIVGSMNAPVRKVTTITAKTMSEPREGVHIYDLEQEMAGVPSITFHEKRGTVITIRYGEMLYPNLPEYEKLNGMLLMENLRDASCTDIYICSGKPEGETEGKRIAQGISTIR